MVSKMAELKPCPFCGRTDISMHAYSISPECFIKCKCGARILLIVPWGDMDEDQHDKLCAEKLSEAWNWRVEQNG